MKVSSEIPFAQVMLLLSGSSIVALLTFPPFGLGWFMSALFFLAGAAMGFRSLLQLWRSDDAHRFMRSARLVPILSVALAATFSVGSAIFFWNVMLMGSENVDLIANAWAAFGVLMVGLSFVLGFALSLIEAVWRAREKLP